MVTDDLGTPVPVPAEPQRIVSLVPSISETLWWFHLADRVVGVTDWCVAPPNAFDHAVRIRGTKNPDVAAVVDLRPDLVVANREENRELDVRRLREAGVAVYVTAPDRVVEAAASLEGLGEAVGAAAAGRGLAQTIERALARLPRDQPTLQAFCPIWRDPWLAVGTGTYAGDLLAQAGFAVVPQEPRYPEVALHDVAALDPDVVLLPDEPYAFGEEDRAPFRPWRARVRRIDGTALTWWGPRTPHALADLARLARSVRRRVTRSQ
jgi:ABC-type Fe3+-hydroxamate transport system substrate-binding protein